MACVVKNLLPNFAGVKALPRVSITNGRRSFSRQASVGLPGDTARAASTGEGQALRREARDLKEVVAEQTLELRLLKKSMTADGGDDE